jgi:hypothetical protein
MAVTIDALQIDIQAKGAESASGIDKLTTSLGALKSMINKSLVGKLESLSSALDGIKAPITVNMNVKGMEQLQKSVQEATANIPANASNITPTVDSSIVTSEMGKIKASTEQASSSFETISSEAKRAKQELKSAGDAAGEAGKKLKEVGTSAKQGASGLSKFVSSLKRILMYRVVRSILSNIARAAREGIQNLVQYSKAIGGIDASRANATMSQFASIGMQVRNALGAAVMPVLNALMPVIQTLANWFIIAANAVNQFFAALSGSGKWTKAKISAVNYAGGLGQAAEAANDLKDAMLGIDELNVISPNSGVGGGGGGGAGGGDLMFEEVEIDEKIISIISWIKDNINEILAGAIAIGGVLLTWKISNGLIKALEWLSTMKGFSSMFSIGFKIAGLGLFLDAWNTMKEAIQDIMENDANFTNVTKLISGFAEGLGASFLLLGRLDLVAPMLIVSGVAGIISDISDMVDNGINWENAMSLTKNLGLFLSGIGLVFGNLQLGGIGLIISGVSLILENLKALITGFETGDFSNVEWIEVAAGALMLIGGLILAFKNIQTTVESVADIGGAKTAIDTVKTTTEGVSGSVGQLSANLTSLVKNLALGIVIVAEVAAAALLITGAIILLGMGLEQVGIAWQPVIDNGGTIAAAMGIGVGILAAIGVVTALLGSVGTPLIVNIALGTAILALLGVATGLFLVEIWAIGKGLDEIGKAWQPVLDNGETIATGIGLGTALLIGIGVVTAALGVATVASAGLLPLAIGLGTALLVELAVSVVLFIESLVSVANALGNDLAPVLKDLNGKLPGLTTDMSDFVDFMCSFAGQVGRYAAASTIAGLSATIDTIIGWFTQDPIEKLAGDVENITEQTADLNEKLRLAVPELRSARDLLKDYATFLTEIQDLTETGFNMSAEMFVNMKEVGQKLVTGLVDGIKSKSTALDTAANDLVKGFNTSIETSLIGAATAAEYNLGLVESAFSGLKDRASEHLGNIQVVAQTAAGMISSAFKTACGEAVREIGKIKSAVDALPTEKTITINIRTRGSFPTFSGGSISRLARGGIIPAAAGGGRFDRGQLFVAREDGPEIVAGIGGGRTAVMNNNQIVESVSNGVYRAVIDAISTMPQNNGDVVLMIGERELARAARRGEKASGFVLSTNPAF